MTIGLVKESMDLESRVALVPDDVVLIIQKGVGVLVENSAGANSGYSNEAYESVGAKIVDSKTAWGQDLVVKCKEPLEHEYPLLKEKATLFSYLDLAYQKSLCEMFIDKKITSICTETIAGPKNDYPILAPMSVVAGRLAAHLVQHYLLALEHVKGFMGKGIMLGGLSGAQRAKIVVVGGGVVGMESAKVLSQMGAKVTILELDYAKLQNHPYYHLYDLEVLSVNEANIIQALNGAVGLVGAVLVTASQTPKVILRRHLKYMQKQGVVIDVACDLGGCIETIRQTSHSNPVYVKRICCIMACRTCQGLSLKRVLRLIAMRACRICCII